MNISLYIHKLFCRGISKLSGQLMTPKITPSPILVLPLRSGVFYVCTWVDQIGALASSCGYKKYFTYPLNILQNLISYSSPIMPAKLEMSHRKGLQGVTANLNLPYFFTFNNQQFV